MADAVPTWAQPPAAAPPKRETAPAWASAGKYGGQIEREALQTDPGLQVTSGERSVAHNAAIGGARGSAHTYDNARDFAPRGGESVDAAYARLKTVFEPKGYKVRLERAGDAHSTGNHIHIQGGDGAQNFSFPVQEPPAWASPTASPAQPQKRATLSPVKPQTKPAEPGWGSTIGSAIENIPSSAYGAVKGLASAVRHPADTMSAMGDTLVGAFDAGEKAAFGRSLKRKPETQARTAAAFEPYKQNYGSVAGFKKKLATDPVGVALDATMVAAPFDAALGGRGAAAVGRAAGSVARPVMRVGESLRSTFNPARASPAAADTATAFRANRGMRGAEADRMAYNLGKLLKRIDSQPAESHAGFYKFIESRSNAPASAKSGVAGLNVSGAEYALSKDLGMNSKDVAAANQIRDVYNHYHDQAAKVIKANTNGSIGFVKDYFPHMWAEDSATVEAKMQASFATKQGSGRYFFKRTIPTIEDGIAAGLTPKYGPIQTVQVYTENMGNLLATHETQAFMKGKDYAKWFRPGQHPEGWKPLTGILTEREPKLSRGTGGPGPNEQRPGTQARLPAPDNPQLGGPGVRGALPGAEPPIVDAQTALPGSNSPVPAWARSGTASLGRTAAPLLLEDAAANAKRISGVSEQVPPSTEPSPDRSVQKEQLYAPPEVARLYNNAISKPFDPSDGPMQAVGHYAYKAGVNAMMWKFALSAYHATTMALESAVSRAAGGYEALSRGQIGLGVRKLATAPFAPVVAIDYGVRGQLLREQILGIADRGPLRQGLAERFAKTGGRLTMDRDYRGTQSKLFYDAWKDGSLGAEMKRQAQDMYKGDAKMTQRAVAAARVVSNLVSSISRPLFEEVIPRIKLGAWSDMMGDYLKANAEAPEEQIQAYANKAWDSIDNRFGEMNRDNMFWSRKTQQILQSTLASPTWKIGSWREIGGGALDLPESVRNAGTGKGISPRTAYLLAMGTIVPLFNGLYQYFKTGKPPEDGRDLMVGRTGAKDPRTGAPERMLFPGNQKEVYSAAQALGDGSAGVVNYGINAGNAVPKAIGEQLLNKDYAGRPLRGSTAAPGAESDWLKDTASPISLSQQRLKGSGIGMVEGMLGAKTAPAYLEGAANAKYERYRRRQAKGNAKSAAKRKAMYE